MFNSFRVFGANYRVSCTTRCIVYLAICRPTGRGLEIGTSGLRAGALNCSATLPSFTSTGVILMGLFTTGTRTSTKKAAEISFSLFPFSCLYNSIHFYVILRETAWTWKIRNFNFEAARRLTWFLLCCSYSLEIHKVKLFTFRLLRKTMKRRSAACIAVWSRCIL